MIAFCDRHYGATTMVLRKTRESLNNSIILFFARQLLKGRRDIRHFPSYSRFEFLSTGSILAYGGMKDESQRERIRSVGQDGALDMVWMEEAIQFVEDDFNEVLARMRGKSANYRQIILSTNPGPPAHWIYKRLIQGGEAAVYYSGAHDNPHNPPDYLDSLERLTGVLRDRLRDGKWVQAEGAVYDEFNVDIHVQDVHPEIRYFVAGVDWGYTNPGVMQVWGVDGDGRLYLVYEVYMTGKLVASPKPNEKGWWVEKAEEIHRRFEVQWMDCDPSEPAYIETLRKAGLPARPANNELRLGIDRVKARLRVQEDGHPRLMIMRGALVEPDPVLEKAKLPTCTLEEFPAYAYPKGTDGKPVKEEPLDLNNHGLDVTRYVVNHLDAPRGRIMQRL